MFQECQNKHRVRKQNIEQNIRNVEKQVDRYQRERDRNRKWKRRKIHEERGEKEKVADKDNELKQKLKTIHGEQKKWLKEESNQIEKRQS